jgi:hypothetical protein
MTSIAIDASDLVQMVANIRDRESLQVVSRLVESELTMAQARVNQLQQLQSTLKERMQSLK